MKYMVQVKGDFGGMTGGWRPACCGTENQSALTDAEASTFDTEADAWAYRMHLLQNDDGGCQYRVVEVD